MPLTIAVVNLLAGLLLLTVGGTLITNVPSPRRWVLVAFVAVDACLISSSLFLLPFALQLGGS